MQVDFHRRSYERLVGLPDYGQGRAVDEGVHTKSSFEEAWTHRGRKLDAPCRHGWQKLRHGYQEGLRQHRLVVHSSRITCHQWRGASQCRRAWEAWLFVGCDLDGEVRAIEGPPGRRAVDAGHKLPRGAALGGHGRGVERQRRQGDARRLRGQAPQQGRRLPLRRHECVHILQRVVALRLPGGQLEHGRAQGTDAACEGPPRRYGDAWQALRLRGPRGGDKERGRRAQRLVELLFGHRVLDIA
mmetsp:Transcript_25982/g.66247  ORF Transcript_25982/g.66247 Transcript_25982/m.66247 type:complete len:243 (-) Transcript_25982:478-1206(-)